MQKWAGKPKIFHPDPKFNYGRDKFRPSQNELATSFKDEAIELAQYAADAEAKGLGKEAALLAKAAMTAKTKAEFLGKAVQNGDLMQSDALAKTEAYEKLEDIPSQSFNIYEATSKAQFLLDLREWQRKLKQNS